MSNTINILITFLASTVFGASTLVIGVSNPIHSLLVLISVFMGGSTLLFFLNVEYFAILFLIVYVGAIVVLFLFIVMMLDIKITNDTNRFVDIFSYRHIIIPILMCEIFIFLTQEMTQLYWINPEQINLNDSLYFSETNLYVDYSTLLQPTDQLRGIGGVLFLEYKTGIFIVALLLFLSMVASIVLTLETTPRFKLKEQDPNLQALKNSDFLLVTSK
jgi:NADH:ubiquinone oxidoreductase subunit 6 (subunit J)